MVGIFAVVQIELFIVYMSVKMCLCTYVWTESGKCILHSVSKKRLFWKKKVILTDSCGSYIDCLTYKNQFFIYFIIWPFLRKYLQHRYCILN